MLLQCPQALKKLIKEGRLEITAGGWVMPDEACTHIYALVDQFIEGTIIFRYLLGAWRQLLYATFFMSSVLVEVLPTLRFPVVLQSSTLGPQRASFLRAMYPAHYHFSFPILTLIYSYKCIYSAL